MISVDNLTKSFGRLELFDHVSFKLNPRERLGLVGRNGHGKTTLLRILTGEEQPDSGIINIPKNYRIGYVRQHLEFTEDTVLKEGMKGLPEADKDHSWKVEKILAGLGFSVEDMQLPPEKFSGGFQVRLNLAKVLVSDPDLLLLDEPTNYLDITSIRWIERFLNNWPHEVILITHDRSFMDAVVTHTMGIHRKKLRKIPGKTQKYYSQIAQEEEIHEKTRMNDQRKRKETELFITRFRAKARLANLVQSRVKLLDKMEKPEKLDKIKTLDFSFQSTPFNGKHVLDVQQLSFGYAPEKPLIKDFDLSVKIGDRVCVIGKNGKGKTTLLKLLGEQVTPQAGAISYRSGVEKGFFEQTNIQNLNDTRSIEEEVLISNPIIGQQGAKNICGAMMFSGDDALKKIGILSGGEKSRVLLGKLLVTPVNLLLLDEPTHHLDMDSCDALLAAISEFPGTVIMVTHNEMFLHALSDRLIVFENDSPYVFDGSYQRFLEKTGWMDEPDVRTQNEDQAVETKDLTKITKKELRRRRSEILTKRAREIKPLEDRITEIENEIDSREQSLESLNNEMQQASLAQDGAKIGKTAQSIHQCQSIIDDGFNELEVLTGKLDQQKAEFDRMLDEIESSASE